MIIKPRNIKKRELIEFINFNKKCGIELKISIQSYHYSNTILISLKYLSSKDLFRFYIYQYQYKILNHTYGTRIGHLIFSLIERKILYPNKSSSFLTRSLRNDYYNKLKSLKLNPKLKLLFTFNNFLVDIPKNSINYENDIHQLKYIINMNTMKKIFQNGDIRLLMFLIENQIINLNHRHESKVLLIYAIRYKNEIIIQYLIDHGVSIQENNDDIIECLTHFYNFKILQVLVANQFDINQQNSKGELLLNYFIKYRFNKIARGLIKCGANINNIINTSSNYESPLICAIRTRNISLIRILMYYGAYAEYETLFSINEYYNCNIFCIDYYNEINNIIHYYRCQNYE
ncbi:hypothetical protein BCR32DRAFT_250548 [Anaeromyces robustus]|uniref:Uncharacterized protein n=1 Tax=Anaeromyces robustus TaxID=1754192 RepID=A0A1Y1VZ16_9FUNG|nr:hypothetical protein BCR32DRAFT_250548 [Anaeromyces robustus]|eukprot:ORX66084.1 hypothetical protein BCR32DRAFT_250548 [Anaeromyces robustus]